ncbi:hypothetical protein ABEB36_004634 [Hypothenemus hampei]|uniref:Uncharacterized protein n=1 Tax=Hypothenemus hampei TaxID=57062 RepID=A0ABD1F409_HYPHA
MREVCKSLFALDCKDLLFSDESKFNNFRRLTLVSYNKKPGKLSCKDTKEIEDFGESTLQGRFIELLFVLLLPVDLYKKKDTIRWPISTTSPFTPNRILRAPPPPKNCYSSVPYLVQYIGLCDIFAKDFFSYWKQRKVVLGRSALKQCKKNKRIINRTGLLKKKKHLQFNDVNRKSNICDNFVKLERVQAKCVYARSCVQLSVLNHPRRKRGISLVLICEMENFQ